MEGRVCVGIFGSRRELEKETGGRVIKPYRGKKDFLDIAIQWGHLLDSVKPLVW